MSGRSANSTQPAAHDAPDEELMSRYARGDVGAFESLYNRHKAPLYRYVRRQVNDPAAVDEIFQDIWTNLIRSRERYEARAKFATWLYRVAHNRVVDWYRARGRSQEVHSNTDDADGDPWDPADEHAPGLDRRLAADRGSPSCARPCRNCRPSRERRFCCKRRAGSAWRTSPR